MENPYWSRADISVPIQASLSAAELQQHGLSSRKTIPVLEDVEASALTASGSGEVPAEELGLRVLWEPEDPQLDIVAVHGLGVFPSSAWKVTGQLSWLEDPQMLPSALPQARILRFGYDSIWFGYQPVQPSIDQAAHHLFAELGHQRKNCARRPIVFIGHCLGGLVIQKTLLQSLHGDQTMLSYSIGVILLGTPHRGTSAFSTQGELMAAISATAAGQNRTKQVPKEPRILQELKDLGLSLTLVSDTFAQISRIRGIRVVSCYETWATELSKLGGGTSTSKEILVPEQSTALIGHDCLPLSTNHFRLSKFYDPNDVNYLSIIGVIQDVWGKSQFKTASKDGSIFALAQAGSKQDIRQMLRQGIHISSTDEHGRSCLHWAASSGNQETLLFLLEQGLRVDEEDDNGVTALHLACGAGQLSCVNILLSNNANPKRQDDHKNTTLHYAAVSGSEEIVELLANHVDVRLCNSKHQTPIEFARSHNQITSIPLLRRHTRSLLTVKEQSDLDASGFRCETGDLPRYLDQGGDVNAQNPSGETLLYAAAYAGDEERMRLLIKAGANVKAQGGSLRTINGAAASGGVLHLLKDDVDNSADLSSALHAAAHDGDIRAVRNLLSAGAKVDIRGYPFDSPIGAAANGGHDSTVSALIAAGASPDGIPEQHLCPLSLATESDHLSTIRLLLKHGAKATVPDRNDSPFVIAAEEGYCQILQHLLFTFWDVLDPRTLILAVEGAVRSGKLEALQLLLLCLRDLTDKKRLWPALVLAIEEDNDILVQPFLIMNVAPYTAINPIKSIIRMPPDERVAYVNTLVSQDSTCAETAEPIVEAVIAAILRSSSNSDTPSMTQPISFYMDVEAPVSSIEGTLPSTQVVDSHEEDGYKYSRVNMVDENDKELVALTSRRWQEKLLKAEKSKILPNHDLASQRNEV